MTDNPTTPARYPTCIPPISKSVHAIAVEILLPVAIPTIKKIAATVKQQIAKAAIRRYNAEKAETIAAIVIQLPMLTPSQLLSGRQNS